MDRYQSSIFHKKAVWPFFQKLQTHIKPHHNSTTSWVILLAIISSGLGLAFKGCVINCQIVPIREWNSVPLTL